MENNQLRELRLAPVAFTLARKITAEPANPALLLCEDEHQAAELVAALGFFAPGMNLLHFPGSETLPYDVFSPYQDIVSQRLSILYQLRHVSTGLVVAAANTLLDRLPPPDYLDARALVLAEGDRFEPEALREALTHAGYEAVGTVRQHGEFAVRGGIFDLYPMGSELAYRIETFDQQIESLRSFDTESQRSVERVADIQCLPARAFPLDEAGVEHFRSAYRRRFAGDPNQNVIYRDVSRSLAPAGVESYLPLFFNTTANLLDYLPDRATLLRFGDIKCVIQKEAEEVGIRYGERCGDLTHPLLPPEEAYFSAQAITERLQQHRVELAKPAADVENSHDFSDQDDPAQALAEHLAQKNRRVLLVAESAGRREVLRSQLGDQGLVAADVSGWEEFQQGSGTLALCTALLRQGLRIPGRAGAAELEVLTETELAGRKPPAKRKRRGSRDIERVLQDLSDLAPGAPVVHVDHGVGRFTGMESMQHGGVTAEYLTLAYSEGAKLFVPVASLHLVRRYSGGDPETAPLHRLGNEQWSKARKRAAEKAHDAAAELLELQARRAAAKGTAFEIDRQELRRFNDMFLFTETEDQQQAIEAVVEDLASPGIMDRVVCGDVGFGKTEVALRAAFVAAHAGYQVCVLTPTTLLAQQHERNFMDRFADWPIRVGGLSRLRTAAQQSKTMDDLATGKLDIVIGTHRLLRPDVKFHRLGLMIVDEEHRFGVKQKEQLKRLSAGVDLLTLTATPIPRTLNMALCGMRDLSLIATPPVRRLPVQTLLAEWNTALIHEACLRELRRGGQVYFVHNRVEDIERIARELREILPQASLAIAHGQMRERELEQVMLDFYHQRINILLCTTIVESGIDVPTANTIIINRADRFGLAQLHQLRGRVGRSHHRAYAYLLVTDKQALSSDAQKRLDAVESMTELGAGFTLATHDMEIRGAGELLGESQSGHIEEIGFDMYLDLLQRAVKSLQAGEIDKLPDIDTETEIELGLPALLPEDYVPDIHARLVLYKRISRAESEEESREIQVELVDRFGLLPTATANLFEYARLRRLASPMGIQRIEAGEGSGRILFGRKATVDPGKLILLVQENSRDFQLNTEGVLSFSARMKTEAGRIDEVTKLLIRLRG